MNIDDTILVAGKHGMVGSAIIRNLTKKGYHNVVALGRKDADLENSDEVAEVFERVSPGYVFLAAAKVGGIIANEKFPVEFLLNNLRIQNNVIEASNKVGVKKLAFLGSSCIYPKFADQPIREDSILSGSLEETNLPYAVAKIAGKVLCDSYRKQYGLEAFTIMPPNVYGIGDNFDPQTSHVVAGLMIRIHQAKENNASVVSIWGTGTPKREVIFSEDLADACVFLMNNYNGGGMINAGSAEEYSILELAECIGKVVGYKGKFIFDKSKPDGTPRKIMDNSKISKLGWAPMTNLANGLEQMYSEYLKQI